MDLKIYTKTGDDGSTGLVGGTRISKSNLRLEAYGTVDELNAWMGLIRSMVRENDLSDLLSNIQSNLFVIGSKLASDEKGEKITGHLLLGHNETEKLEMAIDHYQTFLEPLRNFILPGGSLVVSYCHIARTVCRRAERRIVALSESCSVEKEIITYINRLSDYLFVLARKIAKDHSAEEVLWIPK